jgi:uncharacterized protein with von Willebrand factor type A (vWA) domain
MFFQFLEELRAAKVRVTPKEYLALMEALDDADVSTDARGPRQCDEEVELLTRAIFQKTA